MALATLSSGAYLSRQPWIAISIFHSLTNVQKRLQWFRCAPLEQKKRDIAYLTHLLDDVKKRMAEGTVPECMATQSLRNQEKNGMNELEVAYAVSSPFGAGIETVRSPYNKYGLHLEFTF